MNNGIILKEAKKLNLGAGKKIDLGYLNVDIVKLNGVDLVWDLNKMPWPFKENQFEEVKCRYVLELLDNFINVTEEIWRVCSPGAKVIVYSPLFPNMRSAQDPLTKKFMTYNSFDYFVPGTGLNYYSKAKFKILRRKIIFSRNKNLEWLSFIPNISQKFYCRFLFNLFPSNEIIYKLEVVK